MIHALFFLCFAFSVYAQSSGSDISLFVAPQIFELKAEKGETIKNKIRIYNRGENPIALEAIADDFGAEDESGTINFKSVSSGVPEEKNTDEDVSRWIKIENPNFILDPEEKADIHFSISIPKETKDGGKYAVIFFQPRMPSSRLEENSIKVLPKIGVLFLLKVGEVEEGSDGENMTIAEFNIPENFHLNKLEDAILGFTGLFLKAQANEKSTFSIVETGELSFMLRIKNNDIYHIKPNGKLAIISSSGKILGETEISKTTILPGKIRRIPVEFKPQNLAWFQKYLPRSVFDFFAKNLVWGRYEAKLSLITDEGSATEKNIVFWIFPWKTVATVFVLFIIILLMKKRIIMAGKALFMKRGT